MALSVDQILTIIFGLAGFITSLITMWQGQKIMSAIKQFCKFVPRQMKLLIIEPSPDNNL